MQYIFFICLYFFKIKLLFGTGSVGHAAGHPPDRSVKVTLYGISPLYIIIVKT